MDIKQMIKIQCIKSGNISLNELARRCGWAPPNLFERLRNNTWSISSLQHIASALNCTLYTAFIQNDVVNASSDISELIRIQCVLSGDITNSELASRLGISRQALSQRLKHNKWRVSDVQSIAEVLSCTFIMEFRPIS